MKNKIGVIIIASTLALLCAYFLSFSLISKSIQADAEAIATDATGNVDFAKKQAYLDSLWTKPAIDILGLQYTYKDIKENELHLGLDLQGGMHVVIEVSPVEIVRTMAANSSDKNFERALASAIEKSKTSNTKFTKLFGDAFVEENSEARLSSIFSNSVNKGKISFNSTNDEVLKVIDSEIEDAINRSFNILRTRIDKFGVTQPNIQRLKGTGRIQLELPGVDNPERVRKLLQGTAKLEFVEVYEGDKFGPYFESLQKYLVKLEKSSNSSDVLAMLGDSTLIAEKADTTAAETSPSADSDPSDKLFGTDSKTTDIMQPGQAAKSDSIGLATSKSAKEIASADSVGKNQSKTLAKLFVPVYGGIASNVVDTGKVNRLFNVKEVKALMPVNMRVVWAAKPIKGQDGQEYLSLYFVKKGRDSKTSLEGDVIVDARQDFNQNGQAEVNMQMNANGAKKWRKMTASNIGRRIAILLDNYVYSAPVVQGEIPNGSSSISGDFTIEEAKDLANILKAGKLPAPIRIVEEAIMGPTLGQESIQQGINSTLIGLVAVVIFMIVYYSGAGLVADLALFINLFFLVGVLAQMQAVLTLPGIAGIVLTMGMAVDANVLIYERIREELQHGRTLMQAINTGFSKANSSIVDGNVTTFLVGAILALYGSGPVQGFAVTLMLGIMTSFFTSVFVSRLFFEIWLRGPRASAMAFGNRFSENLFKKTNYNIVGMRKMSYIISTLVIAIGFGCIFINGGLNLGVDFKGGRSYVVQFSQTMSASDVREKLQDDFKKSGLEVKTYGSSDKLKITTSYLSEDESEQADATVLQALNAGLTEFADQKPAILSSSKVGATIADDIQNTSIVAILLSLLGIFVYILIRFRRWTFSLGAIVALLHDALMAIALTGVMNLLGVNIELDQIYIAAILTLIGYSINDTVVVFDRLREFLGENKTGNFAETINYAINNTFSRTIITATTVFLVTFVLYLLGGEILRGFSFVMLVGVLVGTYSSIFIAAPIVVDFQRTKKK